MKVSVIIPVRDGERYIADAIGSVREQTKPSAELLVIDDGSKDETARIVCRVSRRGVRLIQQPPSRAAAARNAGVKLARYGRVAFLAAHDLSASPKLEAQCAELQ